MPSENDPDIESDRAVTTDPVLASELIERYGGYAAHVRESEGKGDHGLLRLAFMGDRETELDEDLKRISWEQFREEFEEKELALVYPDGSPEDPHEDFDLVERDSL